jgi:hypothetical protein
MFDFESGHPVYINSRCDFVKLSSTYFRYLGYVITYMHVFLKLNIGNKYGLRSMLKKCPGILILIYENRNIKLLFET